MILRPYQDDTVTVAVKALYERKNTGIQIPTGGGKTCIFSETARRIGGRQIAIQPRKELLVQNMNTFKRVNGRERTISIYNADIKNMRGDTVFAMPQTLSRKENLKEMQHFDLMILDECHRAVSQSWLDIINAVKEKNPDCMILGVTATPTRSDGKGLRSVGIDNFCKCISLHSMISMGFLVRPRTFISSLPGVDEELNKVRKVKGGEYDMHQAAEVLDVEVHNEAVVREWKKLAGDRKTIVFCSTVEHARHVCEAFQADGAAAAVVTGDMPDAERAATLKRFDKGSLQVLVNVAVLTEGYDSQPVSCVILLRPCSFKSTMLQMIGRGLRTVDPNEYPGVVKTDCIVMDFGRSLLTHGDFESKAQLDDKQKVCPECDGEVPCGVMECPICGHVFPAGGGGGKGDGDGGDEREIVSAVEMMEVDILDSSPFKWLDLFGSSKVMMASGFECWCAVASPDGERWTALGKLKKEKAVRKLLLGERMPCLAAADDFLRMNESDDAAKKNKKWLNHPASEKQLELLQGLGYGSELAFSFTKYSAACTCNFFWNKQLIEQAVFNGN